MDRDTDNWWELAIGRNRAALLRIVAVLFIHAGLDEGGAETLSRRAWRAILAVLRPAESALRRLIVAAARDIAVEPPACPAARPPSAIERLQAAGLLVIGPAVDLGLARAWSEPPAATSAARPHLPAFPLADRPKRFDLAPRPFPPSGIAPADGDEPVDAAPLCRRLQALKRAPGALHRCAPAGRPAAASGPSTKSMTYCANATASPSGR